MGVEHEYVVRHRGARVDFRRLIGDLDVGVAGLDPSDRSARRGAWGGAITADGPEAEVVTPPVTLEPGAPEVVADLVADGRRVLLDALPAGYEIDGFSTHLNIEVPRGRELTIARRLVGTCAAPLMLLMDRADSPGLLIRPRPGRIEFGGEHVDGVDLRVALAFAVGAVAAAEARNLPERIPVVAVPAVERFGWYIDRSAFGGDLYVTGRATPLERRRGGPLDAGTVLERAWTHVRPHAERVIGAGDLGLVDDAVAGCRLLPLERPLGVVSRDPRRGRRREVGPGSDHQPFGAVLVPRSRPAFDVAVSCCTWDLALLRVQGPLRHATIAVRRADLRPFLASLDAGDHDDAIGEFLGGGDRGRRLTAVNQVDGPTMFDSHADPEELVARERDPRTGRLEPPAGGRGGRPGKRRSEPRPLPGSGRVPRRRQWLLAAGVVVVLIVAAVAVSAALGGDDRVSPPDEPGVATGEDEPDQASTTTLVPPADAPDITGTWRALDGGNLFEIRSIGSGLQFVPLERGEQVCREAFLVEPRPITWTAGGWTAVDWTVDDETCEIDAEGTVFFDLIAEDQLMYNGDFSLAPYQRVG